MKDQTYDVLFKQIPGTIGPAFIYVKKNISLEEAKKTLVFPTEVIVLSGTMEIVLD